MYDLALQRTTPTRVVKLWDTDMEEIFRARFVTRETLGGEGGVGVGLEKLWTMTEKEAIN